MRQIGILYRRANGFDFGVCAYCGDKRHTLDHCPPLAVAIDLDLREFRKRGGKLLLFPACRSCNAKLGAKPFGTYIERLAYLRGAYEREIEKQERLWSADEIKELGYNLRQIVVRSTEHVKQTIRCLRGVERALCNYDEDRYAAD